MGTDIHAGIEYKPRDSKEWVALAPPTRSRQRLRYVRYSGRRA